MPCRPEPGPFESHVHHTIRLRDEQVRRHATFAGETAKLSVLPNEIFHGSGGTFMQALTRDRGEINEFQRHRDCTRARHGYNTASAHVQVVDADPLYAVAVMVGCLDNAMDLHAR